MFLETIFLISGVGIALLLLTKMREIQKGRTPLLLRIISLGDSRMKDMSHQTAHLYSDTKESLKFFVEKQLPLHTKNTYNKLKATFDEKAAMLMNDVRGHKIFKKDGGISEYFKQMDEEVEKVEEDHFQNEENQVK
jgi:hypothetical protein